MRNNSLFSILALLLFNMLSCENTVQAQTDSIFKYLYKEMDRYHDPYFYVYSDRDAGGNHYVPSGFYNGNTLAFSDNWNANPKSGCSCARFSWNGLKGTDGWKWNGVMFQEPQNNWIGGVSGYDLSGVTKLSFWIRADAGNPGIDVKTVIGYPGDSGGEIVQIFSNIGTTWEYKEITIPAMRNMSNVAGGVAFIVDQIMCPDSGGCVFYLDDIKFHIDRHDEPRLIKSYETNCSSTDKFWAVNQAYVYDNSIAMLAFLARCESQDYLRARMIGDALQAAQDKDEHFTDGRIRNAYSCGDILSNETGFARLPGHWDDAASTWLQDSYQVGSYTGEMAWTIIAWLTYDELTSESRYLSPALALGQWIQSNCYDPTSIPGYTGGYSGWPPSQVKEGWRSTEHNIDLNVAFSKLFNATGDSVWFSRATIAKNFAVSMWDIPSGHFWTGTNEFGVINRFSPLDAQAWAILAFRDTTDFIGGLSWAEDSAGVDTLGYSGFNFSSSVSNRSIWSEGTAQMICAYKFIGDTAHANFYLNHTMNWQKYSPVGDGCGVVATVTDSMATGIVRDWGSWNYYQRKHLGASSWLAIATMENNFNPYWLESPCTKISNDPSIVNSKLNLKAYPNPTGGKLMVSFESNKTTSASLQLINSAGQTVLSQIEGAVYPGTNVWEIETNEVGAGHYCVVLILDGLAAGSKSVFITK